MSLIESVINSFSGVYDYGDDFGGILAELFSADLNSWSPEVQRIATTLQVPQLSDSMELLLLGSASHHEGTMFDLLKINMELYIPEVGFDNAAVVKDGKFIYPEALTAFKEVASKLIVNKQFTLIQAYQEFEEMVGSSLTEFEDDQASDAIRKAIELFPNYQDNPQLMRIKQDPAKFLMMAGLKAIYGVISQARKISDNISVKSIKAAEVAGAVYADLVTVFDARYGSVIFNAEDPHAPIEQALVWGRDSILVQQLYKMQLLSFMRLDNQHVELVAKHYEMLNQFHDALGYIARIINDTCSLTDPEFAVEAEQFMSSLDPNLPLEANLAMWVGPQWLSSYTKLVDKFQRHPESLSVDEWEAVRRAQLVVMLLKDTKENDINLAIYPGVYVKSFSTEPLGEAGIAAIKYNIKYMQQEYKRHLHRAAEAVISFAGELNYLVVSDGIFNIWMRALYRKFGDFDRFIKSILETIGATSNEQMKEMALRLFELDLEN
jgi:hypothetical protein